MCFCRKQSKQNDRLICEGFRCFGSESGSNSFCRQHYTSCKGRKNHVQSGRNIWDQHGLCSTWYSSIQGPQREFTTSGKFKAA